MNVKLLRKVKRHILEEPRRFVMSEIDTHGEPGEQTGYGNKFAKCGTAACICGWACGLSGLPWHKAYYETAQGLLGISPEEGNRLFSPDQWPEKFAAGTKDDGKKKTALVAAARIEHFIKTKGRE